MLKIAKSKRQYLKITLLLFLILILGCLKSRFGGVFKIVQIDSTSINGYYLLKLTNGKKDTINVLSRNVTLHEDEKPKYHELRIGSNYNLKLHPLKSFTYKFEDDSEIRPNGALIVNDEVIFIPGDNKYRLYTSETLKGKYIQGQN